MEHTADHEYVLQGVFWHLVRHKGLKLGIRDFNEALTALRSGYGLYSRDELLWLCQTLWARNQEEERLIGLLFRQFPSPTTEEVNKFLPEIPSQGNDEFIQEKRPPSSKDNYEKRQRQKEDGEELDLSPTIQFVGSTDDGLGLPHAKINPDPLESFILTEQNIISVRALIIIWRRFRKSLRTGPKVEIDIDATIDRKCGTGLLESPVLIPARRNLARLTILIDVKGSMLPWQSFNSSLLESLYQSQLGHIAIYYFQNVPGESLYTRESLTRPLPLSIVKQMSPDTGLLILSDAGAARGHYNEDRIRETDHFLNNVIDLWHPVAWVNPLPKSRWKNTTAEIIGKLTDLAMFELSEDGLTNAVDFLRGYRDF